MADLVATRRMRLTVGMTRISKTNLASSVVLFTVLAGCVDAPVLSGRPIPAGPPPVILPLDAVLVTDPANTPVMTGGDLAARAAALRARAEAMQ